MNKFGIIISGNKVIEEKLIDKGNYILNVAKENVNSLNMQTSQYIIDEDNKTLTYMQSKITVSEFKKKVDGKVIKNGKEITGNEFIGTGCKVILEDGQEYELVIKGDINGDGKITATDLLSVKYVIIGKNKSNNIEALAGDMDNDEKLSITDLLNIKKAIMGLTNL